MAEEVLVGGGRFILGKKIGGGSFGSVYLGTNKHTREFVGIKLVSIYISNNRRQNRQTTHD